MLDRVRATIKKYQMFATGDRVLAGVSGGPDSITLAYVLLQLSGELGLEIFVAHLNHDLRGSEAEADAEFVRNFAERLGLPVVIEKRDVAGHASEKGLSIQTAAREVRYRFFREAAEKFDCNKLATGHNANDQAETVLFNFLRGAGPQGLRGIPPVRDKWITRPLIETERAEIDRFCRENNLATRLDRSNLKNGYTRNRIRLDLIPRLQEEFNPNLLENLARTSEVFREDEEFLEQAAKPYWAAVCGEERPKKITLRLAELQQAPAPIGKRIIRRAWQKVAEEGGQLGFVHLQKAMETVQNGQSGTRMSLPGKVRLEKSYDNLTLSSDTDSGPGEYCLELKVPGVTSIPGTDGAVLAEYRAGLPQAGDPGQTIAIDLGKTSLPLCIRPRKPGDWFKPVGLDGSKKIKKFFIDQKVPRDEREKTALVVTRDDQVVWVTGLRADRRWLADETTGQILSLKLIQNIR